MFRRSLKIGDESDLKSVAREIVRAWRGEPLLNYVDIDLPAQAAAGVMDIPHGLNRYVTGFVILEMSRSAALTTAISFFQRVGDAKRTNRILLYSTGAFTTCKLRLF